MTDNKTYLKSLIKHRLSDERAAAQYELELAKALRGKWIELWPEVKAYFDKIKEKVRSRLPRRSSGACRQGRSCRWASACRRKEVPMTQEPLPAPKVFTISVDDLRKLINNGRPSALHIPEGADVYAEVEGFNELTEVLEFVWWEKPE